MTRKAARVFFQREFESDRRHDRCSGAHDLSVEEGFKTRGRISRQEMVVNDPVAKTDRIVNAEVLPLTDSEGDFKGVVLVLEDVTNEQRIKDAFEQYLAPTVVEQLLADPDRLQLGGEKREITAMFTDIQDFTQVSEVMDSSELARLLNEYFDEACKIVLRHGGTIDKIVGDALHVLFNAPVDQSDHPLRAVRCALELQAFSRSLRARHTGEQLKLGDTRVGVNTGVCVVGNFGGSFRFDYTAHGDAINTAARLESANKYLGIRTCVSQATQSRCVGIHFRPIGELLLKGKNEAIEVFEPLLDEEWNSTRVSAYLEAYAAMESNRSAAVRKFEQLSAMYPEDGLIQLHMRRLSQGQRGVLVVLENK